MKYANETFLIGTNMNYISKCQRKLTEGIPSLLNFLFCLVKRKYLW